MLSWILCGIWNGDAKILSTLLSKWSLYGASVDYLHSKVCPEIEPDEVVQSWRGGILLTYDPVRDMQGITFRRSFVDQLDMENLFEREVGKESRMNAYIYDSALYCEDCGKAVRTTLDEAFIENEITVGDPENDDSDRYPQGPYSDGGGESDTPAHCDNCGVFLENPLTTDGVEYVRDILSETQTGDPDVRKLWADFYADVLLEEA